MVRLAFLVVTVLAIEASCSAAQWDIGEQARLTTVDAVEGRELLGERDEFVKRMSPFDRVVRMRRGESPSETEFRRHASAQSRDWGDDDVAILNAAFDVVLPKLKRFRLPWPRMIRLVKTTGEEEGGAAYCRGSTIVLPERVLAFPAKRLQSLLIHELFHVLSNHNPELRRRLYAVVGFKPCGGVDLPKSLRGLRITNPDAPRIDYFTEVTIGERRVQVVPILYSRSPYDPKHGGGLFDYLTFRLMVVEREGDSWRPVVKDGEPELIDAQDVPSYFERIGRNTDYIIHPEEVLAENFVLLVNGRDDVATPRILSEMAGVLLRDEEAERDRAN